ncbi:MAG: T9SS type A sorting domain-containing protein [Candidatus Kapabacteria bacterium]|nr:T9SS type A sorting domain-containing protein [Candidatus Kapabacteria bacterium]
MHKPFISFHSRSQSDMKHLFLAALLAVVSQAATAGSNDALQPTSKRAVSTSLVNPTALAEPLKTSKVLEASQAITYKPAYRSDYSPLWEGLAGNRTFVYEPETKTLAIVHQARNIGASSLVGGFIYAETSTDGGGTWSRKTLFDLPDNYMAFLETGVAAVNGSPKFFLFGLNFAKSDQGYLNAGFHGYSPEGGEPFTFRYPDANNFDQYEWTNGSMISTAAAGAPSSYFACRLNPPAGVQYGAYGAWGYDMESDNFTYDGMPEQWGLSKFRPSDVVGSTFNSEILLDSDEDGVVYAAVNNLFADDIEARVPGVSQSDDRGANWTEFSVMPKTLYDTYAAAQVAAGRWPTADVQMYDAYGQSSFVVNGSNDYSYFIRMGHVNTDQQVFDALHLVEARYRNGAWTMEYIADMNDFNPPMFFVQDTISRNNNNRWTPVVQSLNGHEVQGAKTADGEYVVVKWIDANPAFGRFGVDPPAVVLNSQGAEGQLDSLFTTDMYFSVRAKNSTSWGPAVNITNDLKVDKGTFLPNIIPSAENVPVIYHQGVRNAQLNDTNYLKKMNWPDVWTEREIGRIGIPGYFLPQEIWVGSFNALNPNSVQEERPTLAFNLSDAVPNPAAGTSEITWTLDRTAKVTLDLYTMMGTKVTTLSSGVFDQGAYGVSVNASTLAAGAYYFTLTVDGTSVTKPLTIVR